MPRWWWPNGNKMKFMHTQPTRTYVNSCRSLQRLQANEQTVVVSMYDLQRRFRWDALRLKLQSYAFGRLTADQRAAAAISFASNLLRAPLLARQLVRCGLFVECHVSIKFTSSIWRKTCIKFYIANNFWTNKCHQSPLRTKAFRNGGHQHFLLFIIGVFLLFLIFHFCAFLRCLAYFAIDRPADSTQIWRRLCLIVLWSLPHWLPRTQIRTHQHTHTHKGFFAGAST